MGTDIHGVFQRKISGKWDDIPSLYDFDRHYLLFAWLGDVRNGYGFSGVPTHTAIVPLSKNRGYPEGFYVDGNDNHPVRSIEIMPPWKRKYRDDGEPLDIWMGDHSHSWLHCSEILSAHLPIILRTGIVSIDEYRKWDGVTGPKSWSGYISGPNIVVSTPSEITDETSHVRIEWFEETSETFKYFIDEVRRLNDKFGDVRFVFGFDS